MSENTSSNTQDVDITATDPATMFDVGLKSLDDVNNLKSEPRNLGIRAKLDVDPTVTNPDTMRDEGFKSEGGRKRRTRRNKKKSAKRKRKSAKKRTYRRRR